MKRKRVVFMQADDPVLKRRYYIFFGVFKPVKYELRGTNKRTAAVYNKISDEFEIVKD